MTPQTLYPPRDKKLALAALGAFVALICLAIGLSPWIPAATAPVGKTTAIVLLLPGAALSVLFALSQISLRVELDETAVTLRGLFGTRSLPLERIDSATFKSSERIDILTLRASYRRMNFTSYAFSREQLQAIQDHVAAYAQQAQKRLETSPLAAPYTTRYKRLYVIQAVLVIAMAIAFCALIVFPVLR